MHGGSSPQRLDSSLITHRREHRMAPQSPTLSNPIHSERLWFFVSSARVSVIMAANKTKDFTFQIVYNMHFLGDMYSHESTCRFDCCIRPVAAAKPA